MTTPLGILDEFSIQDGVNGYVIPYEVDGFDCNKLLNVPQFEYPYDNTAIIKQWRKVLGNTKPKHTYKPEDLVTVTITRAYYDTELKRNMAPGEVIRVKPYRADLIIGAGVGR